MKLLCCADFHVTKKLPKADDAKAQVEIGKIDDMLSKLENLVQLDQEINGKAAKICLELKGIEPKTENSEG